MKFKGLDGKEYSQNIDIYTHGIKKESRSVGQQKCGELLVKLFPNIVILEEVNCLGTYPLLYLDFYIPLLKLAFEFQGSQHIKYNQFFHGDRAGFAKSQINDLNKARWCEINNIELIYIDEEQLEILEQTIYERINKRNDKLE